MNRINQMIDSHAVVASMNMIMMKMSITPKNADRYAKQFEGCVHDLKMWQGISDAIRRPSR